MAKILKIVKKKEVLLQTEIEEIMINYLGPDIGKMVRVCANGPGDLGSIPGRVIPKTQKWYLMLPCLTLSIIW